MDQNHIENFVKQTLNLDEITVIALAGDASSRKYYRAIYKEASWVIMSWLPYESDETYPFLNILRHFEKHNVAVPQVIATDHTQGLIILEDLGDLTLERKFSENQDQNHTLPFYKKTIDELIKIHYPCSADKDPNCIAFSIEFDKDKLLWETSFAQKHLIQNLFNISLPTKKQTALDQCLEHICETLADEPKLICHRDFHSRNVMLKLADIKIIDFQDARLGPLQYDLVSLVHDSYVNLNNESIQKILDYYIEKALPLNPQLSDKEHFNKIFDLQLLQRCFKACGSFASFYNLRQDPRYLKYIPRTLERIIKTAAKHPEATPLLNTILDHSLLNKGMPR